MSPTIKAANTERRRALRKDRLERIAQAIFAEGPGYRRSWDDASHAERVTARWQATAALKAASELP